MLLMLLFVVCICCNSNDNIVTFHDAICHVVWMNVVCVLAPLQVVWLCCKQSV